MMLLPLPITSCKSYLQVLLLADRLDVPRCSAAAGKYLFSGTLEWETVISLCSLPASCSELPTLQLLYQKACDMVQEQLGDLDATLCDRQLTQHLLSLPYQAFRALMSNGSTSATTEYMIFRACDAWLQENEGGDYEQHAELAACVRIGNLSGLELAKLGQSRWLTRHIPAEELLFAAARVSAPPDVREDIRTAMGASFVDHPTWLLPERPVSRMRDWRFELRWGVSLFELQRLVAQAVADPGRLARQAVWCPDHVVIQGASISIAFEARAAACGVDGVTVGLYVYLQHAILMPLVVKVDTARFLGDHQESVQASVQRLRIPSLCSDGQGYGWPDVFGLGIQRAWDESAWQAAALVGKGHKVHVVVRFRPVRATKVSS